MANKKDKNHSGWYTPRIVKSQMKYSEMHSSATNPDIEYDDWQDYRDGMRYDPDKTHIRSPRMLGFWKENSINQNNKKLFKHLVLRKQRKFKQYLKHSSRI